MLRPRARAHLFERGSDPVLGWEGGGAFGGAVDPALEAEVVAVGGGRVDVDAVDAHGGGAEKAFPLGCFEGLDASQLYLRAVLRGQLLDGGQEVFVAGAAVEVEELDGGVVGHRRGRKSRWSLSVLPMMVLPAVMRPVRSWVQRAEASKPRKASQTTRPGSSSSPLRWSASQRPESRWGSQRLMTRGSSSARLRASVRESPGSIGIQMV